MRKGFIFTLFAFFVVALIILMISLRPEIERLEDKSSKILSDETFYFLSSVESDLPRTTDISGRRALVALVSESISQANISKANVSVSELIFNGTNNDIPNALMDSSSLNDWVAKIKQLSNAKYVSNISFTETSVKEYPFNIEFQFTTNISISNIANTLKFEPKRKIKRNISIISIEDPLVFLNTNGLYSSSFEKCNTSIHARLLESGSQTNINTWMSGTSKIISNSSVEQASQDEIAVVTDICSFNQTDLNTLENYDAIISGTTINLSNPCGGIITLPDFVGGATISNLPNKTYLTLNQKEIWENRIYEQALSSCYFTDNLGPTFFDRVENKLISTSSKGIAHFLNLASIPSEIRYERSALDYVYFNYTNYGATQKIKGVSDKLSWFLLDLNHITNWAISDLVY